MFRVSFFLDNGLISTVTLPKFVLFSQRSVELVAAENFFFRLVFLRSSAFYWLALQYKIDCMCRNVCSCIVHTESPGLWGIVCVLHGSMCRKMVLSDGRLLPKSEGMPYRQLSKIGLCYKYAILF